MMENQQSTINNPVSPWIIALTVMLATFMEVLDTSVANVALPHIAGGLGVDVQESTWALTAYLVSNAIVLPLTGWLAPLFGRKNVYLTCVGLFTLSSFLCGIAPNLDLLILFRILQGMGGGALQPISQAILLESFPPQKRGLAMAVFGMGVVVAPIVGPTLGGWLADNISWRWIFFINLPVGLLSIFLTVLLISDPPYLVRRGWRSVKIDYFGLGLIALGLGCLQIFLDKGQTEDWFASRLIIATGALALVCLSLLILWELFHESPIMNLRLLRDRNFAVGVLTMFVIGFTLYGSILLLPVFLQQLLGYTATLAGMTMSPGGFFTLVMMPVAGALVGRVQAKYLLVVGLLILAYSLFYMAGYNLQIGFWHAAMGRNIQAVGLAFLFVPVNAVAFFFIPKALTGQGTAIINLVRNVGGSFGIAFVTTLLARQTQSAQNLLIHHLMPSNPVYEQTVSGLRALLIYRGFDPSLAEAGALRVVYNTLLSQAAILAYTNVFRILGVVCLVVIPVMFLLKKTTQAPARLSSPKSGGMPAVH